MVDLGSGGGLDVFLAAKMVGPKGRAIGIDMTPAMIERARANAQAGGYTNVEFHLSTRLAEFLEIPWPLESIPGCIVALMGVTTKPSQAEQLAK